MSHDHSCSLDDYDSATGCNEHEQELEHDHDYDWQSNCSTSQWHHEPIVVGYAFGPKKMKSMGVVMAEASKIPVIREDAEEENSAIWAESTQKCSINPHTRHGTLTRAALQDLESGTTHQASTIITLGNSSDPDLQHIVRYFRSSCSSVASTSETTVSTRTTTNTWNSSKRSQGRSPVRISFVPLDPDTPLEEQHGGNFDLILHKLTEDILTCSLSDQNNQAAHQRVQSLKRYRDLINPGCCLVDDPAHVQTLMSRSDIAKVLQTCLKGVKSASGNHVRSPKFLVFEPSSRPPHVPTLIKQLQGMGFSTPLIIKPLIAAGTKESHFMTIVLKWSALSKLPPRSIIQEYVNHNAALYKVYVLGNNVYVYERSSLPNLPSTDQTAIAVDSLEFDSQRPYPELHDFGICRCGDSPFEGIPKKMSIDNKSSDGTGVLVTSEEIRPVVEKLRQAFGLELFGFDIIVSEGNQELLVVDVNYFPSYKEVPNFPSLLAHYLTQRVLEQRSIRSSLP